MSLEDRIAGVLVGLAAGDALGAGYEFGVPPAGDAHMKGGGLAAWEPGEWTDDTQMVICVAEAAAGRLFDIAEVGARFLEWFQSGPADVGIQTRAVLGGASRPSELTERAAAHFVAHPQRAAGNGSLMRTAPVALTTLGDDAVIAERALAVSALTHGDPLAGEACVLWSIAIDRAVRDQRLDGIRDGLEVLPAPSRNRWAGWLDEAEATEPRSFTPNGFVVVALQAAWSVVSQTPQDGPEHLQRSLHAAVRIGHDTDTVAAIAGGLLGARWGVSAVPEAWRTVLHGWPGYRASHLERLALAAAGRPRVLVIDDLRTFSLGAAQVTYARTAEEGMLLLREGGPWDEVWWDHDLGPDDLGAPSDIRAMLAWVEEEADAGHPPALGLCVVHTSNPVAAEMLVRSLSRHYPTRRVDAAQHLQR